MNLSRALAALRRAAATGRDAQTVTVRRWHLQALLTEYEREAGIMPCSTCAHLAECDYNTEGQWCARYQERAESTPPRDAFEALSDAVGKPMRRVK